jgi:hypothetical protein
MNKRRLVLRMLAMAALIGFPPSLINAIVSVYPTGTTIYQPDKTWNGYTLLDTADGEGVALIDMNGNILKRWPELAGMGPFRMFPGGYVMGGNVSRTPYQESVALIEYDWDGDEVWRFDRLDMVAAPTSNDKKIER